MLELERTIPAELLRDAMVAPLNAAWPDLDLGSYPTDKPKGVAARRARTQAVKLEEWPDAECQIEIREELVQLARSVGLRGWRSESLADLHPLLRLTER